MTNALFDLNREAVAVPRDIPASNPTPSVFDGFTTVSPSLKPVAGDGMDTPRAQLPPSPLSLEAAALRAQLPPLPKVECIARARIPTTNDTEIYLHLYANDLDQKEHLAIVFGENIRSKSLFRRRSPDETNQDRMTRGAYIGKLVPGRTLADEDALLGVRLVFDEAGELLGEESIAGDEPFPLDVTDEERGGRRFSRSVGKHQGSLHPHNREPTLVRIHSECYTGETAWSARCDCGEQFDEAGRLMGREGRGVVVYLRQEGRGIGLGEKLKAYNLQDLGADTVQANLILRHPADGRSFGLATSILLDLDLTEIKLMTNNPDKIIAVEGNNRQVHVTERVPMVPLAWRGDGGIHSKEVDGYLRTKIEKMGHLLDK